MGEEFRDKIALGSDTDGGWHSTYWRADDQLVIEWLEYRDAAPYDHARKMVFDSSQEARLREALGAADDVTMTAAIAGRFLTY